jgi:hypothetical protein
MAKRKPEMPGAADHLTSKLESAVADSLYASMSGPPSWSRLFCFCGDGMYRVSVRCTRHFIDVSIRSVTSDGEEDDGISIMFCASVGHRSRIQVEHSGRGLDADVFGAVRFGTQVAEAAAASWDQARREQELGGS